MTCKSLQKVKGISHITVHFISSTGKGPQQQLAQQVVILPYVVLKEFNWIKKRLKVESVIY